MGRRSTRIHPARVLLFCPSTVPQKPSSLVRDRRAPATAHSGSGRSRALVESPGLFIFQPSRGRLDKPRKSDQSYADRWRQSAHDGDSESRALAIPSPRRGSFLERLSCEQINTGPVARVLDTASGRVLGAGTQGGKHTIIESGIQRRLWARNDALVRPGNLGRINVDVLQIDFGCVVERRRARGSRLCSRAHACLVSRASFNGSARALTGSWPKNCRYGFPDAEPNLRRRAFLHHDRAGAA